MLYYSSDSSPSISFNCKNNSFGKQHFSSRMNEKFKWVLTLTTGRNMEAGFKYLNIKRLRITMFNRKELLNKCVTSTISNTLHTYEPSSVHEVAP